MLSPYGTPLKILTPIAPIALFAIVLLASAILPQSQPFLLPTENRALLDEGLGDAFLVGPPGRNWEGGAFGCVRNDGWRMHEGLDIRPLERNAQGEPTDVVMASADGRIAYVNRKAAESSYGKYVVLEHEIDQLPLYTLYAHLASIDGSLQWGQTISAGTVLGVMGRTAAISPPIGKDQAHLHFEIGFRISPRFNQWYATAYPGRDNEHGPYHGYNLLALDASEIFLKQAELGADFKLSQWIRDQTPLFRVAIRQPYFPWVKNCIRLVKRNPVAHNEGVAGFEAAINYNGIPVKLIPRAASEMPDGDAKYTLLTVDEAEYDRSHCRRYVYKKGGEWLLTGRGESLLDLLTQ